MAYIETPPASGSGVKTLPDFLRASDVWHQKNVGSDRGMLSDLWYRGVNMGFSNQVPGVYRAPFTDRASRLDIKGDVEDKRLHLERNMISQFRTAGAPFLEQFSKTQIYFVAQHVGMPTRLLDWSTNPLAALFFACDGQPEHDGFVYAMDAGQIIPSDAKKPSGDKLHQSVMTMRHPDVESAIGASFWDEVKKNQSPYVLPVRPDVVPGRIGQQSSCFTLHMHGAPVAKNPTMTTIRVEGTSKASIQKELHRVNINLFTIYYDLDHLSKEISRGWGL